ncbi:DUF1206 domain-containing protein [Tengunoibacter tsumagoiensis]|uniref:DUF1206 domain-containing protein n=1 Tax=Tengunoibacter tsumagoiensis TaxID=2014871 RepID=A0A402A6A1_9CHLR|nr:DUF1206 domain-containing protein [Tengunoibacter tsumagoiensis]GCE14664.1 hypothetical protein KTT_45230 [Tengunoibacter tsumagoiensis]
MSKPAAQISNKVNGVGRRVHGAATSPGMVLLARCGYAAKGLVYVIIGILAVQLAFGLGGSAIDQRGALQTLSEQPFGKYMLIIVAVGLLLYAIWSFIQAIFDTERKGKQAKGIVARLGYAGVGISYGLLAWGSFQVIAGSGTGSKNSTASAQDWTATLLKQPFGVGLVVVLGLIVLAIAGALFAKAYKAKFQYRLNLTNVRASLRKVLVNLGRAGYTSLGVVFVIVGIFFIVAAVQHNATEAKGLDSALLTLAQQPFGQFLLAIVALGLVAYGIYSFVEARYRRLG